MDPATDGKKDIPSALYSFPVLKDTLIYQCDHQSILYFKLLLKILDICVIFALCCGFVLCENSKLTALCVVALISSVINFAQTLQAVKAFSDSLKENFDRYGSILNSLVESLRSEELTQKGRKGVEEDPGFSVLDEIHTKEQFRFLKDVICLLTLDAVLLLVNIVCLMSTKDFRYVSLNDLEWFTLAIKIVVMMAECSYLMLKDPSVEESTRLKNVSKKIKPITVVLQNCATHEREVDLELTGSVDNLTETSENKFPTDSGFNDNEGVNKEFSARNTEKDCGEGFIRNNKKHTENGSRLECKENEILDDISRKETISDAQQEEGKDTVNESAVYTITSQRDENEEGSTPQESGKKEIKRLQDIETGDRSDLAYDSKNDNLTVPLVSCDKGRKDDGETDSKGKAERGDVVASNEKFPEDMKEEKFVTQPRVLNTQPATEGKNEQGADECERSSINAENDDKKDTEDESGLKSHESKADTKEHRKKESGKYRRRRKKRGKRGKAGKKTENKTVVPNTTSECHRKKNEDSKRSESGDLTLGKNPKRLNVIETGGGPASTNDDKTGDSLESEMCNEAGLKVYDEHNSNGQAETGDAIASNQGFPREVATELTVLSKESVVGEEGEEVEDNSKPLSNNVENENKPKENGSISKCSENETLQDISRKEIIPGAKKEEEKITGMESGVVAITPECEENEGKKNEDGPTPGESGNSALDKNEIKRLENVERGGNSDSTNDGNLLEPKMCRDAGPKNECWTDSNGRIELSKDTYSNERFGNGTQSGDSTVVKEEVKRRKDTDSGSCSDKKSDDKKIGNLAEGNMCSGAKEKDKAETDSQGKGKSGDGVTGSKCNGKETPKDSSRNETLLNASKEKENNTNNQPTVSTTMPERIDNEGKESEEDSTLQESGDSKTGKKGGRELERNLSVNNLDLKNGDETSHSAESCMCSGVEEKNNAETDSKGKAKSGDGVTGSKCKGKEKPKDSSRNESLLNASKDKEKNTNQLTVSTTMPERDDNEGKESEEVSTLQESRDSETGKKEGKELEHSLSGVNLDLKNGEETSHSAELNMCSDKKEKDNDKTDSKGKEKPGDDVTGSKCKGKETPSDSSKNETLLNASKDKEKNTNQLTVSTTMPERDDNERKESEGASTVQESGDSETGKKGGKELEPNLSGINLDLKNGDESSHLAEPNMCSDKKGKDNDETDSMGKEKPGDDVTGSKCKGKETPNDSSRNETLLNASKDKEKNTNQLTVSTTMPERDDNERKESEGASTVQESGDSETGKKGGKELEPNLSGINLDLKNGDESSHLAEPNMCSDKKGKDNDETDSMGKEKPGDDVTGSKCKGKETPNDSSRNETLLNASKDKEKNTNQLTVSTTMPERDDNERKESEGASTVQESGDSETGKKGGKELEPNLSGINLDLKNGDESSHLAEPNMCSDKKGKDNDETDSMGKEKPGDDVTGSKCKGKETPNDSSRNETLLNASKEKEKNTYNQPTVSTVTPEHDDNEGKESEEGSTLQESRDSETGKKGGKELECNLPGINLDLKNGDETSHSAEPCMSSGVEEEDNAETDSQGNPKPNDSSRNETLFNASKDKEKNTNQPTVSTTVPECDDNEGKESEGDSILQESGDSETGKKGGRELEPNLSVGNLDLKKGDKSSLSAEPNMCSDKRGKDNDETDSQGKEEPGDSVTGSKCKLKETPNDSSRNESLLNASKEKEKNTINHPTVSNITPERDDIDGKKSEERSMLQETGYWETGKNGGKELERNLSGVNLELKNGDETSHSAEPNIDSNKKGKEKGETDSQRKAEYGAGVTGSKCKGKETPNDSSINETLLNALKEKEKNTDNQPTVPTTMPERDNNEEKEIEGDSTLQESGDSETGKQVGKELECNLSVENSDGKNVDKTTQLTEQIMCSEKGGKDNSETDSQGKAKPNDSVTGSICKGKETPNDSSRNETLLNASKEKENNTNNEPTVSTTMPEHDDNEGKESKGDFTLQESEDSETGKKGEKGLECNLPGINLDLKNGDETSHSAEPCMSSGVEEEDNAETDSQGKAKSGDGVSVSKSKGNQTTNDSSRNETLLNASKEKEKNTNNQPTVLTITPECGDNKGKESEEGSTLQESGDSEIGKKGGNELQLNLSGGILDLKNGDKTSYSAEPNMCSKKRGKDNDETDSQIKGKSGDGVTGSKCKGKQTPNDNSRNEMLLNASKEKENDTKNQPTIPAITPELDDNETKKSGEVSTLREFGDSETGEKEGKELEPNLSVGNVDLKNGDKTSHSSEPNMCSDKKRKDNDETDSQGKAELGDVTLSRNNFSHGGASKMKKTATHSIVFNTYLGNHGKGEEGVDPSGPPAGNTESEDEKKTDVKSIIECIGKGILDDSSRERAIPAAKQEEEKYTEKQPVDATFKPDRNGNCEEKGEEYNRLQEYEDSTMVKNEKFVIVMTSCLNSTNNDKIWNKAEPMTSSGTKGKDDVETDSDEPGNMIGSNGEFSRGDPKNTEKIATQSKFLNTQSAMGETNVQVSQESRKGEKYTACNASGRAENARTKNESRDDMRPPRNEEPTKEKYNEQNSCFCGKKKEDFAINNNSLSKAIFHHGDFNLSFNFTPDTNVSFVYMKNPKGNEGTIVEHYCEYNLSPGSQL